MKKAKPDLQVALDQRLEDALTSANYRLTLNTQKANARLKLQRNLTFSINGGTFVVSHELISFITALLVRDRKETILLDVNQNPIEITDLEDFYDKITDVYYECMNDYLNEIKNIVKARSPKALIGEK